MPSSVWGYHSWYGRWELVALLFPNVIAYKQSVPLMVTFHFPAWLPFCILLITLKWNCSETFLIYKTLKVHTHTTKRLVYIIQVNRPEATWMCQWWNTFSCTEIAFIYNRKELSPRINLSLYPQKKQHGVCLHLLRPKNVAQLLLIWNRLFHTQMMATPHLSVHPFSATSVLPSSSTWGILLSTHPSWNR